MQEVEALMKEVRGAGPVSVGLVLTIHEPMGARLLGLALASRPGRAAYIPLGHSPLEAPSSLGVAETPARLGPLLADAGIRKLRARAKRDITLLARHGIEGRGFAFDALVASYLLNPGRRAYALDDLALEFLGERRGSGSEGVTGEEASVGQTARAAGDDAALVLRLAPVVTARPEPEGLLRLYQSMELPPAAGLSAL